MAGIIKAKRLAQLASELNVGRDHIVEQLTKHGFEVENSPNAKVTQEMVDVLLKDFQKDRTLKEKAEQISIGLQKREQVELADQPVIGVRKPGPRERDQDEVMVKGMQAQTAEPEAPSKKEAPPKKEAPAAKETEEPKKVEEKDPEPEKEKPAKPRLAGPKVVAKIDLTDKKVPVQEEKPEPEAPKAEAPAQEEVKAPEAAPEVPEKLKAPEKEHIATKHQKLEGFKVVGKIELKEEPKPKPKPVASSDSTADKKKRKRKRIYKEEPKAAPGKAAPAKGKGKTDAAETEISKKEIEEKLRETMSKLAGGGKGVRGKRRRTKREEREREAESSMVDDKILQVTEFISVSELASMMGVNVADVISTCMSLGIMVSINQRLDAEVIELVAEEFGFEVSFVGVEDDSDEEDEVEDPDTLKDRPPIVTIMGHVDHGKTSLLDYIRNANVVAGEKGGITQHIGAYEVVLENGKSITFLDTPGHEAFTAMRARGAKITDVAVIVVAADDNVMPQTKEAISHAQAAGVPLIFAINKIDKEGAQPEKIKEQLSGMNLLVEDWGGKYQSQEISAKQGLNVDLLMEKILLEAELLELKANPDKPAIGSVIEASLDKGRGYVATILVQEGTLHIGDMLVAGSYVGKVKALFNERGQKIKVAGPSSPVQVLGLDGAPQAGEKVRVYESEQDAKFVAGKRAQISREQGLRTQKHITLDEIGRRLALGNFKELNIIIKGDVDGSIEALSDSLLKLSTDEIQINVVHKAVGQITESDVLLASASDAVIIGFQVRPNADARKLAEREDIEIRLYSVIYDAIEEVKSAMEGMLEPKIEEKILGNAEVLETFKITKVGTVAGCKVTEGKILRTNRVRLVRDGIVIYTGELASLKRHKDDVKEVKAGMECGLNIKDYNDVKVGDVIEAFEEVEVKRTL
jgi:translation initiation factor IF-2